MATVLVVDDEPAILRAVGAALAARGYQVVTADGGQAAVDAVALETPDVLVLDLGLPDLDGIEVCRRVRSWSEVPIIVLSADGADDRKVAALDEGADDYVTKPFSMSELLARIRVALRHGRGDREAPFDTAVLVVGDIRVDVPHHRVVVAGRDVDLTPKEFSSSPCSPAGRAGSSPTGPFSRRSGAPSTARRPSTCGSTRASSARSWPTTRPTPA